MINIYRKNTEKDYTGCFRGNLQRIYWLCLCIWEMVAMLPAPFWGITPAESPVSSTSKCWPQLLTVGIHGIGGAPCDGDWYLASHPLTAVNEIMGKTEDKNIRIQKSAETLRWKVEFYRPDDWNNFPPKSYHALYNSKSFFSSTTHILPLLGTVGDAFIVIKPLCHNA